MRSPRFRPGLACGGGSASDGVGSGGADRGGGGGGGGGGSSKGGVGDGSGEGGDAVLLGMAQADVSRPYPSSGGGGCGSSVALGLAQAEVPHPYRSRGGDGDSSGRRSDIGGALLRRSIARPSVLERTWCRRRARSARGVIPGRRPSNQSRVAGEKRRLLADDSNEPIEIGNLRLSLPGT
jgi:hypothetical protein